MKVALVSVCLFLSQIAFAKHISAIPVGGKLDSTFGSEWSLVSEDGSYLVQGCTDRWKSKEGAAACEPEIIVTQLKTKVQQRFQLGSSNNDEPFSVFINGNSINYQDKSFHLIKFDLVTGAPETKNLISKECDFQAFGDIVLCKVVESYSMITHLFLVDKNTLSILDDVDLESYQCTSPFYIFRNDASFNFVCYSVGVSPSEREFLHYDVKSKALAKIFSTPETLNSVVDTGNASEFLAWADYGRLLLIHTDTQSVEELLTTDQPNQTLLRVGDNVIFYQRVPAFNASSEFKLDAFAFNTMDNSIRTLGKDLSNCTSTMNVYKHKKGGVEGAFISTIEDCGKTGPREIRMAWLDFTSNSVDEFLLPKNLGVPAIFESKVPDSPFVLYKNQKGEINYYFDSINGAFLEVDNPSSKYVIDDSGSDGEVGAIHGTDLYLPDSTGQLFNFKFD